MLTKSLFAALPFFVCLVWFAIYVLDYRRNNPAKRMLAWLLLACAGLHLSRVMRIYGNGPDLDLVRCLYIFCTLAIYPLAYLYVRRLTGLRPMRTREFWVLIPALLVCLAAVAAYRFQSINPNSVIAFERILVPIEALLLGYFGTRGIREFRRDIANYYSDRTGSKLRILARIILAYVVFSLAKSCVLAFDVDLSSNMWIIATLSVIYTYFSFAVPYLGQKINFTAEEMMRDMSHEDADAQGAYWVDGGIDDQDGYADEPAADIRRGAGSATGHFSDADSPEERRILAGIRHSMEEDRLFLQPSLKITDLAREVGSNRTYVSDCINNSFGMSFHDYVNAQRIEYAKQLMGSDPDLCLDEVSEQAGFTSESAFYRNFRKFTGKTPNDFRRGLEG